MSMLNGDSWSSTLGTSADITYSFPTSSTETFYPDFKPVSSSGKALIVQAMQAFSAVANITFTLVPGGGAADVIFGQAKLTGADGDTVFSGHTSLADGLTAYSFADVFFNNSNNPAPVTGVWLALHELGNATGLRDFSGLSLSQDAALGLPASEANFDYTVMANNFPSHGTPPQGPYTSTPALLDIETLQYLYGANENGYTAGAKSTSTGLVYSFTTNNTPECIWVGNAIKGATTFDFSACTGPLTINLNQGGFSSTGVTTVAEPNYATPGTTIPAGSPYNNISIAYNTVIQNAIGNNGDDTFIANASGDTLTGGTGKDTFIVSVGGVDTIVGGGGTNIVVFDQQIANFTFSVDSSGDLVANAFSSITPQMAILNGVTTLTGLTTLQFEDTTISAAVIQGHDISQIGGTYLLGSSLMAIFDATVPPNASVVPGQAGISNTTVDYFEVGSDTTVSIMSDRGSSVTGGVNQLNQLSAKNNDLKTVTITGSQYFHLGSATNNLSNASDGVVTDIGATAKSPKTIASSLTLIDASATTGGVYILAGATNNASSGDYNTGNTRPNENVTITYTGLKIEGGSGQDYIDNDAKHGIVTDGNGIGDTVILGGADAKATVGTGDGDTVFVGYSVIGTPETPGTACGDMVKFLGSGTELIVGTGAMAGSTAGTAKIGQTSLQGEKTGTMIDFYFVTDSSKVSNENAAVASASTLKAAENAAVKALNGAGVAYFSFGHNEYFIATAQAETSVSHNDAVVCLVGVSSAPFSATMSSGIVTLH